MSVHRISRREVLKASVGVLLIGLPLAFGSSMFVNQRRLKTSRNTSSDRETRSGSRFSVTKICRVSLRLTVQATFRCL